MPRKARHDGWTPERQKAFIEALADTGSVTRAAGMVNIAQANCYALRRAPGAESFRRAWEAALDFGVQRLKDVAFERAIEGTLVPVFVGGRLMGYRRKYNDALLMFMLRHYGQDAEGRRTVVNYFSTRANASAAAGADGAGAASAAEASATTIRTVISGGGGDRTTRDDASAATLEGFAGVTLDAEAHAVIAAALEACAARRRADDAAIDQGGDAAADALEDDPGISFVQLPRDGFPYRGTLVSGMEFDEAPPVVAGEAHWSQAGAEMPEEWARLADARAAAPVAEVRRPKRKPGWKKK